MCGILGWLDENNYSDNTCDSALLKILHRGPDEQGAWLGDGVFLGMRRLSIIDLSGGQQPIWNEDQTCCIVFNGELYNFLDLRPDLERKGHCFRTRSDTEVILHAYEEWGADCVRRFNGMFAFAIWDDRRKVLFLARDRIGEKPLYYYRGNQRLIFASEIKAILADTTVPRTLNPYGLANFLTFGHAVAPETMYRDIYKLLPGHYLLAKGDQIQIVQYWDVGEEPHLAPGSILPEEEYAERILSLLNDAVHRRMIADVPVGAFLSGGVDSSSIVALMKQHATGSVKTFSLGFSINGAYNELSDARRVANFLGTEHHELHVDHTDLISLLRLLVYHYDEPFGDAAGFPVYLLSRFAREQVKVVLSGDGGDELFGGYRRYAVDQFGVPYRFLPTIFRKRVIPDFVNRLPRLRRMKCIVQALPIQHPARRYAALLAMFSPEMQNDLLQKDIIDSLNNYDPTYPFLRYYAALNGNSASDHLNRLMYIDLKTRLVDGYMEKVDKATMACSLEARLPLLDHRLVELAFQIPGRYKIRGLSTKRIFKRAVHELLPPEVLRKPKHGFSVPTDPWFRGDLKDFAFEVLLDQRTRQRGYFNTAFVERLWQEHIQGRNVWDTQLWLLINFELWHRIYLDGEAV